MKEYMKEKVFLNSRIEKSKNCDLYLSQCGMEDCKPNHDWGPGLRDCFLIHYVVNGKGIFQTRGRTWNIGKGNGFLIFPNDISYYRADSNDPWSYCWVGFNGLKALSCLKQAGLTKENPIFTYNSDDKLQKCISELIKSNLLIRGRELKTISLLYQFMHLLVINSESPLPDSDEPDMHENYVRSAIEYMHMNYTRNIKISALSNYIGLDRSYLYSLFKKYIDMSPQQYLIMLRVEKSCELLTGSELPIGQIACSVGYTDQLLYSRMFKKVKGVSPSEYRLRNR